MNTAELIQDAKTNKGGTYRRFGRDDWDKAGEVTGFYVAKEGGVENWPLDFGTGIIDAIANKWGLISNDYLLGLWQDDKGNWSIDRTEHFQFRNPAILWGKFNNQRAIWDIENKKEIVL